MQGTPGFVTNVAQWSVGRQQIAHRCKTNGFSIYTQICKARAGAQQRCWAAKTGRLEGRLLDGAKFAADIA